jgi:hypothetical protein
MSNIAVESDVAHPNKRATKSTQKSVNTHGKKEEKEDLK